MKYRPRLVDRELTLRLASTGAVVIEGPRACGKTATGRQKAVSEDPGYPAWPRRASSRGDAVIRR